MPAGGGLFMAGKKAPLDINLADEQVLVSKLKINQRLAKRIIAFRPYQSIDDLNRVWGLDEATLERIRSLAKVEGEPQPLEAEPQIQPTEIIKKAEPVAPEKKTDDLAPSTPEPQKPAPAEKPIKVKTPKTKSERRLDFLLVLIFIAAAFFRFSGLNWDQNRHQHPDERFISMVAAELHTVDSIGEYFDTANSTLNPIGKGSYTYGMLPLFITRTTAEIFHLTTYDQITLVGRAISVVFDLLALWMLYLLAKLLYNKKTGVLAAGLYAAAVFPIQMSHYFTVDSFCTVFVISAVYLALKAIQIKNKDFRLDWQKLVYFALFGLVVGMATACKVNALPIFVVILIVSLIHFISVRKQPGFSTQLGILLLGLLLALVCTFLGFRVFQPYAFTGTGFLGSALNQKWLDIIKEVTNQVAGFSEWPPNHHWTDRPFSYAWVNMVVWGMGIPLGIAGWAGWLWSAWRMWKSEWRSHILPFTWILLYFAWQNMQFWRYMRYFLIIYPFIILFAAWALIEILEKTRDSREALSKYKFQIRNPFTGWRPIWKGLTSILLIGIVLLSTYAYAFGFSRIYTRTLSRVAASSWMLKNIPGPLNLKVNTANGQDSYPVYIINRWTVEPGDTPEIDIHPTSDGTTESVTSTEIRQVGVYIYFRIAKQENGDDILTEGRLPVYDNDPSTALEVQFGNLTLSKDTPYYFIYKVTSTSTYSLSDVKLQNDSADSPIIDIQWNAVDQTPGVVEGRQTIIPTEDIRVNRVKFLNFQQTFNPTKTVIKVSLLKDNDENNPLVSDTQTLDFNAPGISMAPTFNIPGVQLLHNNTYQVRYEILEGGPVKMLAEAYALETTWDDALPLSIKYYDPLGGIYQPLNLELYENDTPEKRDEMIAILDKVEYIVIPSNRAYDAMPRLPNRYPMTLKYYQELFDCDCYGDELENKVYKLEAPFTSPLGFDLVATFVSNPSIGPFEINDQFADESFTVYDHPKVLIFKKNANFDIEHVKELLYGVDLDDVLFQSPMSYTKAPTAMQLPDFKLAAQKIGGTWSAMFDRLSAVNNSQAFGAVIWYLLLLGLGLVVFPLVFTVFSGLPDRGYPLARMAALLLTAWLVWMLSSLNILAFTRWSILLVVALIAAASVYFGLRSKNSLIEYFKSNWKHVLVTELVFAAAFTGMLLIRLNNPDLWQPWMGGEKPMDFAFFNSVLKTVYFPPENPWFSGHYLNYYYYGYVVAAIPTKLTGIMPSIAYNLILPGWFAMTGIGVFSVAYNLVTGLTHKSGLYGSEPFTAWNEKPSRGWAYFAATFALLAVIVFGNLYEVKVFIKNVPDMVPAGWYEENPDDQSGGELAGAWQALLGKSELPGNNSQWYFEASRPILNGKDDTPIAEFPYFTFLYGDMHPHLLTMPFYALALGWMLSLLIHPINRMKWPERILSLLMAAAIIGSFSASHTWDFYPFAGLAVVTLAWSIWKTKTQGIKPAIQTIAGFVVAFAVLAILMYMPFNYWFNTEYASIQLWEGAKTPLVDYLIVYGLSLFVMISLLIKETIPSLRAGYKRWPDTKAIDKILVLVGLVFVYVLCNVLWNASYQVLVLGLLLLIGLVYQVFFRRGQSKLQMITWVLYAVGLLLTLMVEVIVLKGDVGRSNMVFRMYIEAWFYCGLSACLALTLLLSQIKKWPLWASISWGLILVALILGSISYPYLATGEKIADRWPNISNPPKTLDGMAYMLGEADGSVGAVYDDEGKMLDISEDYAAIQYMQDNVKGSPVIVEGHTVEYKWGSRFSVYTGLPSVIGWSWHTRQHNSLLDGAWITKRIDNLDAFYNTTDLDSAKDYLSKYDVSYIIVGDLERAHYSSEGLAKFQQLTDEGILRIVFGDETENTTTVYEVTTVQ